ncbi:hypothetical protein [Endozoicomonas montiporae]|uniref:hypothetical protein n=1 Tax=Endozoicomonas montiporae TaxID=1027273 RepID=UPI000A97581B|nr:hypothetical protein [Endozoicomonas montiporae]
MPELTKVAYPAPHTILEKGQWQQVQTLEIPSDGLDARLKDFGYVKLFRTILRSCS